MNGLELVQKTVYEIRHLIISDNEIRKFIRNDGFNPLNGPESTIEEAKPYAFVSPVYNTNIEPFNKNTFLAINLTKTEYDIESNFHDGILRIHCMSRSELWEIANDKIRPLEIISRIIKKLDNQKLSSSQTLSYVETELVVLDDNIQGYSALFILTDGAGLESEF